MKKRLTSASLKELTMEEQDEQDDNMSLTSYRSDHTHAIPFEKTYHGIQRSEQRNISDSSYQRALKYGFRYKNGLQEESNERVTYLLHRDEKEEEEQLMVFVLIHKDRRITNMITCYKVDETRFKGIGYNSKVSGDVSIGKATKPFQLKPLIESGMDPKIIMRKCCFVNNLECTKYLIENGLVHINDICDESLNQSWLHYSTNHTSIEIVEYLTENGIDRTIRESRYGSTAHDSLTRNILSNILNHCNNQDNVKQFMKTHGIALQNGKKGLTRIEAIFIEKVILKIANGLKIKPLIRIKYMLTMLSMLEKADQMESSSLLISSESGGGSLKFVAKILVVLIAITVIILITLPK